MDESPNDQQTWPRSEELKMVHEIAHKNGVYFWADCPYCQDDYEAFQRSMNHSMIRRLVRELVSQANK